MHPQRLLATVLLVGLIATPGPAAVEMALPSTPIVRQTAGSARSANEESANRLPDSRAARHETSPHPDLPHSNTPARSHAQALPTLPLRFIANAGQSDPAVRFTVQGAGHTIFFTRDEIVFSAAALETRASGRELFDEPDPIPHPRRKTRSSQPKSRSSIVRLRFLGANPRPTIEGLSPMRGAANFFLGNDPADWRANVPTYQAVAYRDLYPGVDLVYRGTEGYLKSEFLIAPGTDPSLIQMAYSGLESVSLREDGALVLQTPLGELIEQAPLIYQQTNGVRQIIPGGYVLLPADLTGFQNLSGLEYHVGFQATAYDPTRPLVIDPALVYASYLGGSGADNGSSIAVDGAGNIYVTGKTASSDFPTRYAMDTSLGGTSDVFVTQIISVNGAYTYGYSTYIGGAGDDGATGIAVDSAGNAYVTGVTKSGNFPTWHAIDPTLGGSQDAFVTQIISVSGVYTLGYSTYLGGSNQETAWGIAVDGMGNACVSGETISNDFPTRNAVDATFGGFSDAFVTQIVSASGVYTYGYSTYLGGTSMDYGHGIAVDGAGNTYVTGRTESSDFPTYRAIQPTSRGGWEGFVTQIISASGGYAYGYSSYLGGSSHDSGNGIAVDGAGNIYVTGGTSSSDFPTYRAVQPAYGGGGGDMYTGDAFVTQIISAGGAYTYGYSTYLGGNNSDVGSRLTVDETGNAYVSGETTSPNFPTRHAIQLSYGGGVHDAFVTQIIAVGGVYTYGYSTYLGGSDWDHGRGIAVDGAGNAYVTGYTQSGNFPTRGAIQPSHGGSGDAFIVRLSGHADLAISKTVAPATVGPGWAITYTLVYTNDSPATAAGVLITDVVPAILTDVDFASSGASITPIGGVDFVWQVADLAPGTGGVITITGRVDHGASGIFSLTNQATIAGTDPYYAETNLDNNTSSASNTIDDRLPVAPMLVSPLNGAVLGDTTPTLVWEASSGATGYWLNWNGAVLDVGNTTQYTTPVLTDGIYTWTVAAYDDLGHTSPYTDTWSFTIDATPPGAPTLLSPANGAAFSDTTPTLVWQVSPGATGYRLNRNGTVLDVGNVTQYTTPVLADGVYTWTVAAYDAVGNASPYADAWSFTVDTTPPNAPVLLSPANGAVFTDTTPTLVWQASPGAAGYWLKMNGTATDRGNVTQCTIGPLPEGRYTWTVAAYDALRNTSPYTDTRSFTVDTKPIKVFLPIVMKRWPPIPYDPLLSAIDNADGDSTYTVYWTEQPARLADTYTLQEATDAAFTTGVRDVCMTAQQSCVVSGRLAGTYYYRVRGHNAWADSAWSNVQSAVVLLPDTPTLYAIDNADGDGYYVVSWSAAARASSYALQEDANPAFSNPTTVYAGAQLSWFATGKVVGTYHYRVRAEGPTGQSGWSAIQPATVSPPDAPILNPIQNPNGSSRYTISWNASARATSYILQTSSSSSFANAVVVYEGPDTSYHTMYQSAGTHYYRVQAVGPTGTSAWSSSQSTTVRAAVHVVSSNAFVPYAGSSSLYIVGEVHNTTSSNVQFVRINATLRDSGGNVVGSDYTYSDIYTLAPGMTSPFLVLFSDPPAWASYDLVATWSTTSRTPYPLEILNHTTRFDAYHAFHVAGEIRNQYGEQRTFVKAFVTLYDADHNVIGVDYAYTNPDDLNPGQTASFDVEVYFYKGKPDHNAIVSYRLQVYDD